MFCQQCGNQLNEQLKFCPQCGVSQQAVIGQSHSVASNGSQANSRGPISQGRANAAQSSLDEKASRAPSNVACPNCGSANTGFRKVAAAGNNAAKLIGGAIGLFIVVFGGFFGGGFSGQSALVNIIVSLLFIFVPSGILGMLVPRRTLWVCNSCGQEFHVRQGD